MSVKTVSRSALALAVSATIASGALLASTAPANAAPAGANTHLSAAASASNATSSTVSTKWTWASGHRLAAAELKPGQLSSSSYYLRVDHNQGNLGGTSTVTLPNGHGVGITSKGQVVELTKTGPHAYVKGSTPKGLYSLAVHGGAVYGVTDAGVVYRFAGATKAAKKVTTIGRTTDAVFSSSRVYWTATTSVKGGFTYQVMSRSLTGGAARVEAKGARSPQLTDAGILVVTAPGTLNEASQGKLTGIGLLKKGTAVPYLKFNGSSLNSQIGDGPWTFAAAGHTLTLSNAGTSGQLIINLRTSKAWHVSVPKGTVPGWTGVDGNRAAFTVANSGGSAVRNTLYIADVDKGSLKTLSTKTGFFAPTVNGKAIGWTYDRSATLAQYKSIVLK